MGKAAIYVRISRDLAGLGLGVARQEEDCRAKAAREGLDVVHVFIDNDVSAYSRKPRPGYRALLEAIRGGEVDTVIVWHTDRLYRRLADLEGYIAVCQPAAVPTLAVQSGPLDLTTPAGRMIARQMVVFAQYESEHKAVRQQRANLQRARQGKHFGTRRPWAFEVDGVTVREGEAQALRDAYQAVIDGVPLAAIARDWNQAGYTTPQAGNPWDSTVLGRTLRSPRHAGIRTYQREILYEPDGTPVRGEWPALVDLDTWQAAQRVLDHPSRKWPAQSRGVLSGIAQCDVCDAPVNSGGVRNGRRRLRCRANAGHVYREAEPIEQLVAETVRAYLKRPEIADQLRARAAPGMSTSIRLQLAQLQQRSDELVETFATGLISGQQLRDGQAAIAAERAKLERALPPPTSPTLMLLADSADVDAAWAGLSAEQRRVVIAALLVIKIKPTRTKEAAYLDWRKRIVNPETVELVWRQSASEPNVTRRRKRIENS